MTTTQPRKGIPYAVVPLGAADAARILDHFLALDAGDRALRFGTAADDAALARYVESLDFERDVVLGVAGSDGTLIGLAHVAFLHGVAELGLSVAGGHRQRGLAAALSTAALRAAQAAGVGEFRFHSAATNAGMRRLAQRLGMAVEAEGTDLTARRTLRRRRVPDARAVALAAQ